MRRLWLVLAFLIVAASSASADDPDATILRVFLKDGTAIASFGEYARVGDRVVFSMLLAVGAPPRLQLVDLPASAVDWAATTAYADAARYAQYVSTRAHADYVALTNDVARALNEILTVPGTPARLEIALRTRRALAEWPSRHYGYRAKDIQEMSGLLDEAISELQVAAGEREFALSLVAAVEPPDTRILLPPPTLAESIEQALVLAKATDLPADRLSLLDRVAVLVDEGAGSLPAGWIAWARESVRRAIDAEARIEREYSRLARRLLGLASTRAAHADVRGVEAVVRTARREDTRLGGHRPGHMQALLAELDRRLDAARQLRLARDQWTLKVARYRAYRRETQPLFAALDSYRTDLEQIRSLAGPGIGALDGLLRRVQTGLTRAAAVHAPDELQTLHATLVSSLQLAANAARLRHAAAASADLTRAWDASSAAAGSLLLAARARGDLDQLMRPPKLQ